MNLAENIYSLRKQYSLTQEELAERCNVSRQAVAKWETGESIPNIEKIINLAELFKVSIDELVGRNEKNEYEKFKEYIQKHHAMDIPQDDEDDISAIVVRYLLFVDCLNLDYSDRIKGLEEIFLANANV